jgi:hypothetical protein
MCRVRGFTKAGGSMFKHFFFWAALFIPALGAAQELVAQANAFVLFEQSIVKEQLSSRERAKTIAQAFVDFGFEQAAANRADLSTEDVYRLFAAQFLAISYTNDGAHLRSMEKSFSELARRDKVERKHVRMLHEQFIKMRRFNQASALADKFPKFNLIVPAAIESKSGFTKGTKAIWIIDKTERRLKREPVQFAKDWELIVISHPLCHFSTRSLDDIKRDAMIVKMLKGHLKLISPQDGQIDIDMFLEWNMQNPAFPIHLVDQQAAFTGFDEWATPTFYFMKAGKVVYKFSGWPKDGNRDRLEEGMRNVGALHASRHTHNTNKRDVVSGQ